MSRDEELLMKAALSARLPWFSPDAEPEYAYRTDPQEQIDKCCSCPNAVCINCLSGRKSDHRGRDEKLSDPSVFIQLIAEGLSVKQVCATLGIGRKTFYNYKNKLKGAIA